MTRLQIHQPVKVLVVDDSAIVRKVLRQQLEGYHDIRVVATAPDPFIARDKILTFRPDVMILDLEMPRMKGIPFLQRLMQRHPIPTIIFSSVTPEGGRNALEAIAAGAVDVICKPGEGYSMGDVCVELVQKIRAASQARLRHLQFQTPPSPMKRLSMPEARHKIFAIGASTGGVQALTTVLSAFPENVPGTLVVQHMPKHFTSSFAERLNRECLVEVKEAQDGDQVFSGRVLIAPGGTHMVLQRSGIHYYVKLQNGERVFHQKPSVEVLFNSVAGCAGAQAVGAILTGMGQDGALGLLRMRQQGAHTVAQNESSCVVYGMPKEAIACGAAEKVVPLHRIAETMIQMAKQPMPVWGEMSHV